MPTTFFNREQGFEAKFAHDEALRFRLMARRDKLFARWAAASLGLAEEEREVLVKTVLAIPNGRDHDHEVLHCIAERLRAHEGWSEEKLASILDRCRQQAEQQLLDHAEDHEDHL